MSFLREVLLSNAGMDLTQNFLNFDEMEKFSLESIDFIEESFEIEKALSALEQFNYVMDGVGEIVALENVDTPITTKVLESLLLTIGIEDFDCDVSTEDKKEGFWKRLWETIKKMLAAIKKRVKDFFKRITSAISNLRKRNEDDIKNTKNMEVFVKNNPTDANDQKQFIGNDKKEAATTEPNVKPIEVPKTLLLEHNKSTMSKQEQKRYMEQKIEARKRKREEEEARILKERPERIRERREARRAKRESEDIDTGDTILISPFILINVSSILTQNIRKDTVEYALDRLNATLEMFLMEVDLSGIVDDVLDELENVIKNPDKYEESYNKMNKLGGKAMFYARKETNHMIGETGMSYKGLDNESYGETIISQTLLAANKNIDCHIFTKRIEENKYTLVEYKKGSTYTDKAYLQLFTIDDILRTQEKTLKLISLLELEGKYEKSINKTNDRLERVANEINRNFTSLRQKGITDKKIQVMLKIIRWGTTLLTNPMIPLFTLGANVSQNSTLILEAMQGKHKKLNPDFGN